MISARIHGFIHYIIKLRFSQHLLLSSYKLKNLISCKIIYFGSDGGGEYVNASLKKLFKDYGIFHHISCPYIAKQNGVAERKHRHLVETGMTLLFNAFMPLHYWVDAFSTAVYLIYRLPEKSLHFASPWQLLFSHPPNYLTSRGFGYSCYPWLRPYSSNKLEPPSKRCTFFSYSHNYYSYKCFDVSIGKVFLSWHVVFDEDSFPFQ